MGAAVLVLRLALRDLRRHRAEAALLFVAILATATTLTLGLVLRGVTDRPYERTREATRGPDVVAEVHPPEHAAEDGRAVQPPPADVGALRTLAQASGVRAHGGPYALATATMRAHGHAATVQVEGRSAAPAAIDRPVVTSGRWVQPGGVVAERSFAEAFDVGAGDRITLGGQRLRIAGVAVSAAMPPYPSVQLVVDGKEAKAGLVWLTDADLRRVAPDRRTWAYVLHLRLDDPAKAPAFVAARRPEGRHESGPAPTVGLVTSWEELGRSTANVVRNEREALLTGSWLLVILAIAGVAVLVGARMAEQLRRVGLLKAVGATPGLVASVLLAEYLLVALAGAVAGLVLGRLLAPWFADPGAGVLGGAGALPFGISIVLVVLAVALGVALLSTLVPAFRAARVSTVRALNDTPRPPRRIGWVTALSRRLPVPLLVGVRTAARRPRRALLSVASVTVTVSGLIAALAANAQLDEQRGTSTPGLADPRADRLSTVLLLLTAMLVAQAAVNATFVTWATVLDARRSSALARAFGATPGQVSTGLAAAQLLPAVAGGLLGVPGGLALFSLISEDTTYMPGAGSIALTVVAAIAALALLVAIPARIGARRRVAEVLRA